MTDSLQHLAISPSGFVFDPTVGATFTANPAARVLLEGIRDGLGLEALAELLEERFEIHGEDLSRDVLEFVRVLQDEGVLPRAFELD